MDDDDWRERLTRRERLLLLQWVLIAVAGAALLFLSRSLAGSPWRLVLGNVVGPALAAYALILLAAFFGPAHTTRTWPLWPPDRLLALPVLWFAWVALYVSIARGPSAPGGWGLDLPLVFIFAAGAVSMLAGWLVPYLRTRARRASAPDVGSPSAADAAEPSPARGWHEFIVPVSVFAFCVSGAAALLAALDPPQVGIGPEAMLALKAAAGNLAAVGALLVSLTPRPLPTAPWATRALNRGYGWAASTLGAVLVNARGAHITLTSASPLAAAPAADACLVIGVLLIWLGAHILRASRYQKAAGGAD